MANRIPEDMPKKNREEALDEFWDISRLVPEKPRHAPPPASRTSVDVVEVEIPRVVVPVVDTAEKTVVTEQKLSVSEMAIPVGGTHFVPPHTAEEMVKEQLPCDEYTPDGVLLHKVKVFDWPSGYHYFDQFIRDAQRFHAMRGSEGPQHTFFSYFPQYVQMNRRQTAWYLWWREEARAGRYLDTDYAYILLYMFERLNLPAAPQSEEARDARDAMARTWMAYRRTYPQLDRYMCEWLCDYCLIHHLQAPVDILSPALNDIIAESRLKEFYLTATMAQNGGENHLATARILLRHSCQYDYRKSKFAAGEHKGLFDSLIPAAIAAVFPLLTGQNGQKPLVEMQDCTVTRDAYTGALCAYRNKRRIEVSYTSFSRSHELRFLIGDMVKHTENRIRSRIGVRSRLSVMSLPVPLRDALDEFLLPRLPDGTSVVGIKKKEGPRPAYEQMYDAPRKTLSLADADAIERASWETTRILTEAFDGTTVETVIEIKREEPIPTPVSAIPEPLPTVASPLFNALGEDRAAFIRHALDGNAAGQKEVASRLHKMPDAIADEINGITTECEIFDMVLEDDGLGTYTVLDDYRDVLIELLGGNT